jgi:hypothetical protein
MTLALLRLLIDEWDGRAEAERRRLLARLRQTNFYFSAELVDRISLRLSNWQGEV